MKKPVSAKDLPETLPDLTGKPPDLSPEAKKKVVTLGALVKHNEVLGRVIAEAIRDVIAPLRKRIAELEAQPAVKYLGVHVEGKTYFKGNFVTAKGSLWHANRVTVQKPGMSDDWTLAAKRGADGKDLRR